MVGDALSLKSRPVSASNGHWRGPFFAERRKGPLAAGHLPGNPPKTSQNRGPGGHMWGKSPQPSSIEGWAIFPDGRKRNMCHFLDGNRLCANSTPSFGGELATNEPYAHFAAGGQPSSGARSGMRLRRAGPMAGLSRFSPKLRPVFQAKRGATDAEGARRRREGRAVPGPDCPDSPVP